MSSNPTPSSQNPPRQRKPPFADYPTIKILTPPQGRFSPKTDEWCFTYCSQSINGRIHGKEPYCRTLCIRKVFPHEVRNVLSFKHHRSIGADGKARYPLPAEGQPENVPKFLGGQQGGDNDGDDDDDPDEKPQQQRQQQQQRKPETTKYWDESWYMWTGKGRFAMQEKVETMLLDLELQQRLEALKQRQRQEAATVKNKQTNDPLQELEGRRFKNWGYVVPRHPSDVASSDSLLVPLPPDFPPFWERIDKLLAPTVRVLGIFRDSLVSGEQKKFAMRVWEKAWTDEPFILASRTFTRVYERWKENEDDRKKDSP